MIINKNKNNFHMKNNVEINNKKLNQKNKLDYKLEFNHNLPKNKYWIQFDTDKLPLNFSKWILIDIKKIDKKSLTHKNGMDFFCLNNYGFVVIESFREDFLMEFGEILYKVKKGRKYIPIFNSINNINIVLNTNVSIYVDPNYDNIFYHKCLDNLYIFLSDYNIIYHNFLLDPYNNIENNKNLNDKTLVYILGYYSLIYDYNTFKQVEPNNYYFEYEKSNPNPNSNSNSNYTKEINFIDQFLQYEIIKIISFV